VRAADATQNRPFRAVFSCGALGPVNAIFDAAALVRLALGTTQRIALRLALENLSSLRRSKK